MENMPNEEQLEMMKKQWELMGIDPDQMLQHLNNSIEMAKEAQKEMSQNPQEELAQDFYEEEDDRDEMNSFFAFKNVPFLKEDSEIRDEAVLKELSFGSNLAFLNCEYLNTLETYQPYEQILAMLSTDWGIENKEEFLEMLGWLEKEGHRKYFDLIRNNLMGISPAEWASKIEATGFQLLAENMDNEDIQEKALNVVLGYNILKEAGGFTKMEAPDILSWDLGRAINLVRWGYDVKFLTKEEAIDRIHQYAALMKTTYNSWEALSEGYLMGFMMWSGNEDNLEGLYEDHQILLTHKDSPWTRFVW